MKTRLFSAGRAAALLGALLALAGCASPGIGGPTYGYADRPIGYDDRVGYRTADPRGGYVYYPDYEVYYDQYRGEYVYVENGTWVRTRQPRHVDVNVLVSTPSVHLEFRDSPARHHRDVIRTYPRSWRRERYDPYDRYDRRYDPRHDRRYDRRW